MSGVRAVVKEVFVPPEAKILGFGADTERRLEGVAGGW
jgi:hypothetical protein